MHDHPHGTSAEPVRQRGHGYRATRAIAVAGLPVALGAAVATLGLAAPAMADPSADVTCGSVLTASVVLNADLNCTGDGLVIGADGITVNLAGHSITGAGTGSGILAAQHTDLTVHSGSVAGFATDVNLSQVQVATLTALSIRGGQGIRIFVSQDVQVVATDVTDATVLIQASQRTALDNLMARQSRIDYSESNVHTIARADLVETPIVGFESDHVSVVDSRLSDSPIDYFATSRDWVIQNNVIRAATTGVEVGNTSPRGRIVGNTFIGNGVGVHVRAGLLDEVDGTVISDNTFIDNGAAGVLVDFRTGVLGTPTMTISGNRLLRNGFQPDGRTDHLGRPVADGVHVTAAAGSMITVADNLANHDAAYGIFADPGTVIDGGGNKSVGDPLGCLGVVCHPEV